MSRNSRPARSRRDSVTLPPESEITQSKALAWLLRHPDDTLVEPRFFQSLELGALAAAAVDLGAGAQAEAVVEAAAARGHARETVESALDIALSLATGRSGDPVADDELLKAVRELRVHWASAALRLGEIGPDDLHRYSAPATGRHDTELVFVRASEVTPKPIQWLWPGYIPQGKITLFAGRPKTAKSAMAVDITARVSRGLPMPYADKSSAKLGRVIICMAEDDPEDMIVPRLIAAGADLDMIDIFRFARTPHGERGLDIARDIAALEQMCRHSEVVLIVIDPVMSFIGADTDTNSDSGVRYALWPIKSLAERLGVAVIFNSHQRKGSGDDLQAAAMGSTAFTGVPRATFAICHDPRDRDRKLMISTGMNVGAEPRTLGYSVRTSDAVDAFGAPFVAWDKDPHDLDERGYRQLIREQAARDAGSELTKATDFLDEALASGPVSSKSLVELAVGQGISERTLDRARKERGCVRKKQDDGWWVGLPGAFDSLPAPTHG
jgi:putative DNA primase/helicase